MENISSFLNVAAAMGVPAQETFQTVDLWERQNLNSVVTCLQSLGRKVWFLWCGLWTKKKSNPGGGGRKSGLCVEFLF